MAERSTGHGTGRWRPLPDQMNKARHSDLLCSATNWVLRGDDERSEPVSATKFGGTRYLRTRSRLIDLVNDWS